MTSLTQDARAGELEIIVVCNGCTDATASIARRLGDPVRVVETTVASKANAINIGDQIATGFPRFYVDADVVISLDSVRRIADYLEKGTALAAAPVADLTFPSHTSWPVRAYYAFWMALPYVQEGMITAGVYAASREGRARFGKFPEVISDDGYFRLQFGPGERAEVQSAHSAVWTPANLSDLIRVRTRSRVGMAQLRTKFPDLFRREAETKHYCGALMAILRRPPLYLSAIPYLIVYLVSRIRAQKQIRRLSRYAWERDESSRRLEIKA